MHYIIISMMYYNYEVKYVIMGSSTRVAISFMQASKALAMIRGRAYVIPEDIKSLRYSILRHRITLNYSAIADGVSVEQIIDAIVNNIKLHRGLIWF